MSIKKKARHKNKNKISRQPSFALISALADVEEAMNDGNWDEAQEMLEELNRTLPNRPEILRELVNVHGVLENTAALQKYCKQLTQITPNDADIWHNLAIAYLQNSRLALGVRALREFLRRFPHDQKIEKNRELLIKAEEELRKALAPFDFPAGEEGFELACWHEEAQVLMEQGDYPAARSTATKVIARMPEFVSPRNNLSLIYFLSADVAKAVETAREVLQIQPENYHALANLARYLDVLGQQTEAQNVAAKLRQIDLESVDAAVKKAETFSYLRDDAAVVEVFKEAEAKNILATQKNPFIYHLAAAATCRLGNETEARQLWKEALKIEPHFDLAQENLKELDLPIGEGNAPFPFTMQHWVRGYHVEELARLARKVRKGKNEDKNLQAVAQQFFARHREILHLLPILLERGDRAGREFATMVAMLAQTPETLQILKNFVFSQNGSDDLRYKAATSLAEKGAISKSARLWMKGEWQDLKLMAFNISFEPVGERLPPKLEKLFLQGHSAIIDDKAELAEQYLSKFLELKPDYPSALYSLSKSYEMQGRQDEALQLTKEIHERFPDYSFAALTLARAALHKGEIEEAERLLDKVLEKNEYHISEMRGIFPLQIELSLARKQREGAEQWLEMWAQIDDDFDYDYWNARVKGDLSFLKRMLGFGK